MIGGVLKWEKGKKKKKNLKVTPKKKWNENSKKIYVLKREI